MRCPSCGAEVKGKICEYCRREIPEEKSTIVNNYYGDVPKQESNNDVIEKKCEKCGSTRISYKREKIGTVMQSNTLKKSMGRRKNTETVSLDEYRTIGMCDNCGHTWTSSNVANSGVKKSPTWLWVLGWIFMFPIPLTILMLRKKDMNPKIKYGIIAVAWIVYLLIALSGDDTSETNKNNSQENNKQIEQVSDEENNNKSEKQDNDKEKDTSNTDTLEDYIENIVKQYNNKASQKLEFKENFTPSDRENGHYRTEFRLGAYKDAVGKSYKLNKKTVDIIGFKQLIDGNRVRVYATDISLKEVKEIVNVMSPLMDKSLKESDLKEAMSYVKDNKYANGYYYGELGLGLEGSDEKGYELMLKND